MTATGDAVGEQQVGRPPPRQWPRSSDVETIEVDLLLEAVFRQYGFDFRHYARSSIRRRLWRRAFAEGVETLSGLQERILHDPAAMERLLLDLSINVTAMFRDPTFFRAFREKVAPVLRTYPFLRIWNAGCSTGEETYSLAILLSEVGLYDRCRIYATDINEAVLRRAADGVYPLAKMKDYTENYIAAGGSRSFSEYYVTLPDTDNVQLVRALSDNIVFAQHNLVSDSSFNEFHAIVCRNVMIYFDGDLQARVLRLFLDSLVPFGVLALGHKESVRHTPFADELTVLDEVEKLYRRRP